MLKPWLENPLVQSTHYRHEVIQGEQAFLTLATSWNDLLEQSHASHQVFLTHECLKIWLTAAGPRYRPVMILVYDEDTLVGIAPLCSSTSQRLGPLWRTLSFMGDPLNGYYDFIIDKRANPFTVSSYMLDLVREMGKRYALVRLRNTSIPTAVMANMWSRATASTFGEFSSYTALNPIVDTRHIEWQEYDRLTLTKKMRYALKRAKKHGPTQYRLITESTDVDPFLDQFFKIHTQRWSRDGLDGIAYSQHHQQFLRELAHHLMAQSKLHLALISINDELAACTFGFHDRGELYCYTKAFNPALSRLSPGTLMVYHLLKNEYRNYRTINFMVGSHDYKYHWANDEFTSITYTLFRTPVHRLIHHYLQKSESTT